MAIDRIYELFPDVTGMSDEELMEQVRQIRRDRRVTKNRPKTSGKQRASAESKLRGMLGELTPEQLKELLSG